MWKFNRKRHVDHLVKLEEAEQDREYSSSVSNDQDNEDIYVPFTGNDVPARNVTPRAPLGNLSYERPISARSIRSICSTLNNFGIAFTFTRILFVNHLFP